MPKIRDRATICWKDPEGTVIKEEVVTYDSSDEDEGVPEEVSEDSLQMTALEALSIDKLLLILIMDDALEKIGILRCTSQRGLQPCSPTFPEYKVVDERFGQTIEYGNDLLTEARKRHVDLTMVYSILYKTLEELRDTGSYSPLVEGTKIIKKLREDEERLSREADHSIKLEEEYKHRIRSQKKVLEGQYDEKLESLRQLELKYEDTIAYSKLELKYLEKWEEARRHQAELMHERAENAFLDIISTNQTQIDLETRIHGELVRFFEENAEEMNNDISYWTYRYENEIESRDQELLKLRMDREAQTEKMQNMKATYESRKEFIEYWGAIKEQRIKAAALLKKQIDSVLKIQRWWRVVMFKKKLGPYRKKKRRKGKKKGGKRKK